MQRITCYCLVFCGLLFAASCNTPPTGNTADTSQTPAAGETMPAADQSAATNGRNYTLTTLDTTIKSPRKELKGKVDGVDVTINYGSPAVNGRTIYGDLVPYGQVWRTGANEATRITFAQPVKVGAEGKDLAAGTYSLFTLPADMHDWTIIFNKTADQWGAYDYAEADDVVRVKGTAKMSSTQAERMDFALEGNNIQLMWADMTISFPISAAAK
ncbi:hypothetical protein GGR28_001118 [Lewinella aquimaris]|uniref:DUF2911 domain-containing protein n=1 Tax=Neolewinella aquimaris TaxID=1835722 RepID=A0A840E4B2_9BACT|nr:DUF2911 domain-containing protein [Neolewinella aquimaris]MBB4078505.1 hypothetical protein [Neolewinella aquimaris]